MTKRFWLILAAIPWMALGVRAQHPNEAPHGQAEHGPETRGDNPPRANGGRVPPPPSARASNTKVEEEHRQNGRVNSSQHVANDHWYGHDAPNDKRYKLDRPFEHGHFEHFGTNYRYKVIRVDRDQHRFWFPGGFYFEVASWDWFICADWCWDCGDDFVVYEDPDHPGWYLVYNVHTGAYVHATYLGT